MIQKTFGIYSPNPQEGKLFMELGKNHLAAWTKNEETAQFLSLELFQFTLADAAQFDYTWQHILQQSKLLNQTDKTPLIILENEECTTIPEDLLDQNLLMNHFSLMKNSLERNLQIEHGYDIEVAVVNDLQVNGLKELRTTFPAAETQHKYKEILRHLHSVSTENLIKVYFYSSYFIAVVIKENQLQLIRHFDFQTPEDALYYILLAIKQTGLPADTPVEAVGMIDTDSPLYKTLYRYISRFYLEEPGQSKFMTSGFQEFPLHYFSLYCFDSL
ncbi:MAG: DUF3822 family protein [Bacteroidetes bacterium]|nr:DUF3822 family protein [Bacteroidota bacterium]